VTPKPSPSSISTRILTIAVIGNLIFALTDLLTHRYSRALDDVFFAGLIFYIRYLVTRINILLATIRATRKWAWHANPHLPPHLRLPDDATLPPERGDPL
jgi:hypothetical protein